MDSFYQRKFKVHGFNKEDVQSIQPSINKQRRQLLHPMDAYLSHVMSNDASRMSASSVSVPYTERIETSGTGISSTTPLSGHAFTLLGSPDSRSLLIRSAALLPGSSQQSELRKASDKLGSHAKSKSRMLSTPSFTNVGMSSIKSGESCNNSSKSHHTQPSELLVKESEAASESLKLAPGSKSKLSYGKVVVTYQEDDQDREDGHHPSGCEYA